MAGTVKVKDVTGVMENEKLLKSMKAQNSAQNVVNRSKSLQSWRSFRMIKVLFV